MFDFRYHALSLVAVFVALGIGLLLGVAVGDQGLVSGAERDLREDLRADVESARGDARDMREELARRREYEDRTYPGVVGERLQDRRIAVLTLHAAQSDTFANVRSAVDPAGAEVAFVGRLRLPPDLDALAAAAGDRYEAITEDRELLAAFARRLGEQMVTGGRLLREARTALFSSSSGSLEGAEAFALVRGEPPEPREGEDREAEDRFVAALLAGIRAFETPVAGVERTDTEPSQIPWYEARGLPSVDNVDQPAGGASLVAVLAGAADGAFGVKPTADGLVPAAVVPRP